MEREAKLITIGIWTGVAYRIDDDWYVNPQHILEEMGFDWVTYRKRVVVRFADDILLIERPSGTGKWRPVLMRLEAAVRWMSGFAGNNHLAPERRSIAQQMAAQIAWQFETMALEAGIAAGTRKITVISSEGQADA